MNPQDHNQPQYPHQPPQYPPQQAPYQGAPGGGYPGAPGGYPGAPGGGHPGAAPGALAPSAPSEQPSNYYEESPDYSDPSTAGRDGFGARHYVFKDGLRIRQPGRGDDDRTYLHIMPDFGADMGPHSWFWYRYKGSDGVWRFSQWIRSYFVWEFVGGKIHILAPQTLGDANSIDPVQLIYDKCRSSQQWMRLVGIDPLTKKRIESKDALQERKLQQKVTKFVFNAVNTARVHEGESNQSCLYTLSKTAVVGATDDNAQAGSTWGLFSQLNLAQRQQPGAQPPADYDFDSMYYWGDITRADRNLPVMVFKAPPPTGSKAVKLYNCVPMQDQQPIHVPAAWLETRVSLRRAQDVFVDYEREEVLTRLEAVFAGISTDLLLASFEGMIPNYRQRLNDKMGLNSHSSPSHPVGHAPTGGYPGAPAPQGGYIPPGAQAHGGYPGMPPGAPPQGGYVPPGAPPQQHPQGGYVPPGAPPQPQGGYVPPGAPPQQGGYMPPGTPPQPQGGYVPPGAPPQHPQGGYVPPGAPPQGGYVPPGAPPQHSGYVPPGAPPQQPPPGYAPPPHQQPAHPNGPSQPPLQQQHVAPAQVPLPTAPPQQPQGGAAAFVQPPEQQPVQPAAPQGTAPVTPGVGAAGTAPTIGAISDMIFSGMQGAPGVAGQPGQPPAGAPPAQ